MPKETGNNQQIVLNALSEHGDLSLMELRQRCVPTHMTLQGLDSAVGSLLRRNIISLEATAKMKKLSLLHTEHLSQTERFMLTILAEHPEPIERLVVITARSLKVSETGTRMHISQLRKKGYAELLNIPKRAVYITQAGLDAIGGRHVV